MSKKILNLTQHDATPNQKEAGVIDPEYGNDKTTIRALLTFNSLADTHPAEIRRRALLLAQYAHDYAVKQAMIGGAPYLMGALEWALTRQQVIPVYAFSRRIITEEQLADGTVKKTAIFIHEGFVTGVMADPNFIGEPGNITRLNPDI